MARLANLRHCKAIHPYTTGQISYDIRFESSGKQGLVP